MKKGFTLIEILVVVAIIGLFMGMIIASISSGQRRSKDTRMLTGLGTALAQAEAYYGDHNNYTGACDDEAVNATLRKLGTDTEVTCAVNGNKIAFTGPSSISGAVVCVDNAGHAAKDSTGVNTDGECIVPTPAS